MTSKLGAIGLGHWFFRLNQELMRHPSLQLYKAAATSSFDAKAELLGKIGVPRERYYQIKPGSPIPEAFIEGLDAVYISTPNEFHSQQTMQALAAGKYSITEKTFGATKEEFGKMVNFIKEGGYEQKAYLHLHYLHKPLVIELPKILEKVGKEHGKVDRVAAVFWEEENEIDAKRAAWLLSPQNGGIFMDWIHPIEILFKGALATRVSLREVQLNELNSAYSKVYPTGVDATAKIEGRHFSPGCVGTIRVGKGLPKGYGKKMIQMRFESGALLHLGFVSYENELDEFQTGYWELTKSQDPNAKALDFGRPERMPDLFAIAMEGLCAGKGPDLSLDDAVRIFESQWEYQELAKGKPLVKMTKEQMDLGWTLV